MDLKIEYKSCCEYLNIEKKILTSLRNITPLPNFPASRGPPRLKRAAIAN